MAEDYILIVDDTEDQRELLCAALDMSGFRSVVATNGQEALDQIARERPRAILLDLMMPTMSGFEVLRRLETLHAASPIPVIVISAYVDSDNWDLAKAGLANLPGVVKMIAKGNLYLRPLLETISKIMEKPAPAWVSSQPIPPEARQGEATLPPAASPSLAD